MNRFQLPLVTSLESHSEDVGIAEAEISDEALILRLQEKDISALWVSLPTLLPRAVYSVCGPGINKEDYRREAQGSPFQI